MKRIMIVLVATVAVLAANAQGSSRRGTKRMSEAMGADGGETVARGKALMVSIDGKINLGESRAPGVGADGTLLPSISRKPRYWGVLEAVYTTRAMWLDELTVNWYVLTKTPDKQLAKSKAKMEEGYTASPYSFFNGTLRYVNIPKGRHMTSMVLDPSTYERYGKPVVASIVITNKEGDTLAAITEDTVGLPKSAGARWWEAEFMNNTDKRSGEAMIVRRSGLLDRSKTPFWLVNPGDFEMTQQ